MLRLINRRLGIGAYSLFMIEQKNNPKLKGLRVAERGKTTSDMYKALSPQDRDLLLKRAAAHPSPARKNKAKGASTSKKSSKKIREASAYANFVKENIHKFDKLPGNQRMKGVAKLWKQQKQYSSP